MSEDIQQATFSQQMLRNLKVMFNYTCLCCGRTEAEGAELVIDHIQSRAQGGADDLSNMQLLCVSCNSIKRHRTIDFRDPSWYIASPHWSVAEQFIRRFLANQGRPIAWHRDYQLPKQVSLYIELWACHGYREEQLEQAFGEANALGYAYPESLPIANAILRKQHPITPNTK